jgi:hypothetical protein
MHTSPSCKIGREKAKAISGPDAEQIVRAVTVRASARFLQEPCRNNPRHCPAKSDFSADDPPVEEGGEAVPMAEDIS